MNKKIMALKVTFAIIAIVLVVATPVFAAISTDFPSGNGSVDNVDTSVKRIWGTVTTVVQILAFAAIVFAGLRYMFASADQKADIKKGLGMLTVGAVLVFASATVVQFITNAADQIL